MVHKTNKEGNFGIGKRVNSQRKLKQERALDQKARDFFNLYILFEKTKVNDSLFSLIYKICLNVRVKNEKLWILGKNIYIKGSKNKIKT